MSHRSVVNISKLVRVHNSLASFNIEKKERIVTDALFFLARLKSHGEKVPPSHAHLLLETVDRIRSLKTPIRISREDFLDNLDTSGSSSKYLDLMESLKSTSNISQLISLFNELNLAIKYLPKNKIQKSQIIPFIEMKILELFVSKNQLANLEQVSVLIPLISVLKISNVEIFRLVIDSIMAMPDDEVSSGLNPALALKLIQELGWSGFTHDELITEKLVPVLKNFKNYQALTSTLIIGGGLEGLPTIVEQCMETIRRDRINSSSRYPLSVEGHCQIIRRLVICGYFGEAMELFNHFEPKEYADFIATNSTCRNQIYRLFLASFVSEIVPRSQVEFLQTDAVRSETESQTLYDMSGINGSTSSFIHTLVVNTLTRLGYESVSEYYEPETMLSIDIYVPSLKLGIEVQGPSHFITDIDSGVTRMRPEDRFKINVLNKVGINMEIVSIHEFGRKNATRNADLYIENLISKYIS